jgi:hypothetical protein
MKQSYIVAILCLLVAVSSPILSLTTFQDIKTATLSFQTNGGSPIQPIELEIGQALYLPETTKQGYSFSEWYKEPSLTKPFKFLTENL